MRWARALSRAAASLVAASACGEGGGEAPDQPSPAAHDVVREIAATALDLDLSAREGTARLTVTPSSRGLSLDVGDLAVHGVARTDGVPLAYRLVDVEKGARAAGVRRLEVDLPASAVPVDIVVRYGFAAHDRFDGWMPERSTSFLWPSFCGNLFPCRSGAADASSFALHVTGVPEGSVAVFPARIDAPAPTWMPAIAVGAYAYRELGVTPRGTHVGIYRRAEDDRGPPTNEDVFRATADLPRVFAWYEETLGTYAFGDHVASVSVDWGVGGPAGMEHHPFWHVSKWTFANEEVHAHEAAHGWFGTAIRLRCPEDVVLSEGVVSYLTARATEAVRGRDAAAAIWASYEARLARGVSTTDAIAWPETCGAVDAAKLTQVPYMKGAFFLRAVAERAGVSRLDAVLRAFYDANRGKAAGVGDLVHAITEETGLDCGPLVATWLRGLGLPAER